MVPNTNTTELGDLYTNTLNADVIQGNNGFSSYVTSLGADATKLNLKTKYYGTFGSNRKATFIFTVNPTLNSTERTIKTYTNTGLSQGETSQELVAGGVYDSIGFFDISGATNTLFTLNNEPVMSFNTGKYFKLSDIIGTQTSGTNASPATPNKGDLRMVMNAGDLIINGKVRIVGESTNSSDSAELSISGKMNVGDGDETDSLIVKGGKAEFYLVDNAQITDSDFNGKFLVNTTGNHQEAIKLHADSGANQTIVVVNDEGTSNDAIALTSTVGGVKLTAKSNTFSMETAGDVKLTSDTGSADNILVTNTKGTANDAIALTSTVGGISLSAAEGKASMVMDTDAHIVLSNNLADKNITIHNKLSEANVAIALTSTIGGIEIDSKKALSLNSENKINIGDDNIDQEINIGTGGTRTITIGKAGSTIELLGSVLAGGVTNGAVEFNTGVESKSFKVTSHRVWMDVNPETDDYGSTDENKKTIGAIQVVGDIADTKYPSNLGSNTVSVVKDSTEVATTGLWSVEVGKEYLTLWNGTDKVTTFRPRLS